MSPLRGWITQSKSFLLTPAIGQSNFLLTAPRSGRKLRPVASLFAAPDFQLFVR